MNRLRVVMLFAVAGLVLVGATTVVSAQAEETSITFDGENLTVAAGPNQTISGQTTLSEGEVVIVRLTSSNSSSPFLEQANGTVSENGSFAVRVDLSSVEPGTQFNVTVRHDGRELHNTTGTVVACDGGCETPQTTDDSADSNTTFVSEGDAPTLRSEPNQTISGETDLESGTELTLWVRSNGSANAFMRQSQTTVNQDGSFSATVDLSDAEAGSSLSIAVRHNGTTLAETKTIVGECTRNCSESLVAPRATSNGTALTYEGDQPTYAAGPNQTISGRTDLEPGTDLRIRLESASTENPFLVQSEATVTEYGTFEVTANLSILEPEATFDIIVSKNGTVLLETTGMIVECESNCSDTTATTLSTVTSETTPTNQSDGLDQSLLGGGALAAAGVLAFVGLALLLGIVRP